ncbi:MAG: hypothetical protein PHY92_05365 [Alphaproteobacteria bacterium]|nr:hypothetical protein [Alphaproteobacteria bacterium]
MDTAIFERAVDIFRQAATASTSSAPDLWTPDNPLLGHCAVASFVAKDVFRGKIVGGAALTAGGGVYSHYWNLIGGREYDFTSEQFQRMDILEIRRQPKRLMREINGATPLFGDTYKRYMEFRARTIAALSKLART